MTAIHHPSMQNLEEVYQFMIRCDIDEFGEPDSSQDDLQQLWSEIDLDHDAWIMRDEQGNLSGYACVSEGNLGYQQDVYILVSRALQGLEDQLMKLCEDRVREKITSDHIETKSSITGYATSTNQRIQKAYESSGFVRHNYHYQMQIDFSGPYDAPIWPDQYRLEPYRLEDEQELYHLYATTFDWSGHVTTSIDAWRKLLFRGGRYDPQLFVMLRDGNKLIGAALSYLEDGSGWIRQLAVHKEYQGRGLGALLLKYMFSVYSQKKASGVGLGVSSKNETAYRFYERNGMYRKREYIEYRKELA